MAQALAASPSGQPCLRANTGRGDGTRERWALAPHSRTSQGHVGQTAVSPGCTWLGVLVLKETLRSLPATDRKALALVKFSSIAQPDVKTVETTTTPGPLGRPPGNSPQTNRVPAKDAGHHRMGHFTTSYRNEYCSICTTCCLPVTSINMLLHAETNKHKGWSVQLKGLDLIPNTIKKLLHLSKAFRVSVPDLPSMFHVFHNSILS